MTKEQINDAIAEVIQWTGIWAYRPNYCGDLNDMHEAEMCLTPDQQVEFAYQLSEIVAPITGESWKKIHASANFALADIQKEKLK